MSAFCEQRKCLPVNLQAARKMSLAMIEPGLNAKLSYTSNVTWTFAPKNNCLLSPVSTQKLKLVIFESSYTKLKTMRNSGVLHYRS